jgi:superfamily II DNA/RNA helicase
LQENVRSALVFCNRKRDVSILFRSLTKHGFSVGQFHGSMTQTTRIETLEAFKRGDIQVLVCSDVATRGIDINELSHVFNFDVPTHAEDYVHRIGRTGHSGRAFTLVTSEDSKYITAITRLVNQEILITVVPGMGEIEFNADNTNRQQGRHRQRLQKLKGPTEHVNDKFTAQQSWYMSRVTEKWRGNRLKADYSQNKSGCNITDDSSRKAPGNRCEGSKKLQMNNTKSSENKYCNQGSKRRYDDKALVGLGEHVPAFLLRPIRRCVSVES